MTESSSAEALDDLLRMLEYPRRRNLPWVIGVFADLSGPPVEPLPPLSERRFVEISAANFDRVLAGAHPRIVVNVDLPDDAKRRVDLSFERLGDFEPASVLERDDVLHRLFVAWQEEMRGQPPGTSSENAIEQKLRTLLSGWCSQVLQAGAYRQLEATWRGLRYLVDTVDPEEVVIRVLNASQRELAASLRRYAGTRWDKSPLFRKVYDETREQYGAHPYSLLIADMGFSADVDDCQLLHSLKYIGAASYAPLLTAATPRLFGENDFDAVANLSGLRQRLRQPRYAKWSSVRDDDLARFLGVCLPRVLIRGPYVAQRSCGRAFPLDEQPAGERGGVWMNPAYAVASTLVNGVAGHTIYGLIRRPGADNMTKAPVEAVFDREFCDALADVGLISIAPATQGAERVRVSSLSTLETVIPQSPHRPNAPPLRDFNAVFRQSRIRQRFHVMRRDGVARASLRHDAYLSWRARFDGQSNANDRSKFVLDAIGMYVLVGNVADAEILIEACNLYDGRTIGAVRIHLV